MGGALSFNFKLLWRIPVLLVVGASIAFGLINLMQVLIDTGSRGAKKAVSYKLSDPILPPEQIETPDALDVPEYQETQAPPPPPQTAPPPSADADAISLAAPTDGGGLDIDLGAGSGLPPNSEMIPIIRVNPTYPTRAAQRGIEGWVLLEFTVDEEGKVINPKVVGYEPSPIFNSAALRAIRRWRYRPRVVDGVPQIVDGQRFRLRFNLEKD